MKLRGEFQYTYYLIINISNNLIIPKVDTLPDSVFFTDVNIINFLWICKVCSGVKWAFQFFNGLTTCLGFILKQEVKWRKPPPAIANKERKTVFVLRFMLSHHWCRHDTWTCVVVDRLGVCKAAACLFLRG